jgi:exodeoxyribonuclease VII small subunit
VAKTPQKKKTEEPTDESPSFEAALERLEAIVTELDDGNLPLDRSLALFKEGTALAKRCRAMLAHAEVQVKEALSELAGANEAETE